MRSPLVVQGVSRLKLGCMPDTTDPTRLADGPAVQRMQERIARMTAKTGDANRHRGRPEPTRPAGADQQLAWERVVRPELAVWRLENLHVTEVVPKLQRWAVSPAETLVLQGPNGSGKTRAAAALLYACWAGGRNPCLFDRFSAMLEAWMDRERTEAGRELRLKVRRARFAVLDDVGKERITEAVAAAAGELWDTLAEQGCKIIITTNLNAPDRETQLGTHLGSRIGRKNVVQFPKEDLRHRGLPAPQRPATEPCPFQCDQPQGIVQLGRLGEVDLDAIAAIQTEMQAPGPRPWYGWRPEDEQIDPEGWALAFSWHAERTYQWCPHCRPDKLPRDSWLARAWRREPDPLPLPDDPDSELWT